MLLSGWIASRRVHVLDGRSPAARALSTRTGAIFVAALSRATAALSHIEAAGVNLRPPIEHMDRGSTVGLLMFRTALGPFRFTQIASDARCMPPAPACCSVNLLHARMSPTHWETFPDGIHSKPNTPEHP